MADVRGFDTSYGMDQSGFETAFAYKTRISTKGWFQIRGSYDELRSGSGFVGFYPDPKYKTPFVAYLMELDCPSFLVYKDTSAGVTVVPKELFCDLTTREIGERGTPGAFTTLLFIEYPGWLYYNDGYISPSFQYFNQLGSGL